MHLMSKIRTVCVYCGSGSGTNPRFIASAKALGKVLADNGIRLVYGGGSVGMMGAVASAVLDHGGSAAGFANGLQRAGYATDPQYGAKLMRTIEAVPLGGSRTAA